MATPHQYRTDAPRYRSQAELDRLQARLDHCCAKYNLTPQEIAQEHGTENATVVSIDTAAAKAAAKLAFRTDDNAFRTKLRRDAAGSSTPVTPANPPPEAQPAPADEDDEAFRRALATRRNQ